jgi:Cu(I)/Ag(I) efflux system protein CusF
MKAAVLVTAVALVTPGVALAAESGMTGTEMSAPKSPKTQAHAATGVVKKLDLKSGTVTLAHDPVKSLGWPAMTMGFQVKDRTLMDKLAVDRKIAFEFVQQGKDYVITGVK